MERVTKKELKDLHASGKLGRLTVLKRTAEYTANRLESMPIEKLDTLIAMPTSGLGSISDYSDKEGNGVFTVYKLVRGKYSYYLLESICVNRFHETYEQTVLYVLK